jgi:hypothetical protein
MPPKLFPQLAKITGLEEQIFQQFYHDYFFSNENREEFVIRNKGVCPDILKICPMCLKQFGYIKKNREINFNIACSVHGCLLINRCNKCGRSISIRRKDIWKCDCSNPITELPIIQADECEYMFSKLVDHIFNEEKGTHEKLEPLTNSNLTNLTKGQFAYFICQLVSKVYYDY